VRLQQQPNERIDRTRPVRFFFAGRPVQGFEGDTIGSALFASGRRVFSRSFKYHRRRGLLCCSGACPNCMMQVDGEPNVRVCLEPVREGAQVQAQNVLGSLERDLLAAVDHFGGPFTPVGFYYRTMIRPRSLWPVYEKFLRNIAGLGRLDKHAGRSRRFDTEHRRAEVLVIGGGRSGREAARSAAVAGRQVVLVDERGAAGANGDFEVLAPARAIGIYEGGLVPVDAGSVLYRFRAERIVVATGALEQPLVFPGNDLIGVYLPEAVRRLVDEWSVKPGDRAVIVSADDRGLAVADQLQRAGTNLVESIDLRSAPPRQLTAHGRRGRLSGVVVDGREFVCDMLVMSGGRQPAYSLLAQAGARIEYDAGRGIFVPSDLPPNV
jgi:sarcosine oxidase subunit alpha